MLSSIKKTIAGRFEVLLDNQSYFMGLAIIFVILYHSGCKFFYLGFVGVDVFLFLSGYRLSYSIARDSDLQFFYLKRFLKIYPLFFVLATTMTIISFLKGNDTSWSDWFCNITSLSYYSIGGFFFEWYLCSLFLFYLIFPLLYKFSSFFRQKILVVCLSLSFALLLLDFPWYYDCALGRAPIFILGILFFLFKRTILIYSSLMWFGIMLFCSIILYTKGLVDTYVIVYFSAPFIMFLLTFMRIKRIQKIISVIGKYTLEIYVANVIAMNINIGGLSKITSYVLMNALCIFIIIHIGKLLNKSLCKIK